LEQHHGLNVELDAHIWLLQYLYMGVINEDALQWAATWNQHPMRLPSGQAGGKSPINQYLMGLAENGLRGIEDSAYEEDGDDYGIDWADLDNGELVQNILQRRGGLAGENRAHTAMAAPPHWSKVEVTSPTRCPIDPIQLQELDRYVHGRLEGLDSTRMDVRRMRWTHGMRYLNQLLIA
jgi:hypothetical protein